ncbi:Patatin-like [Thraustotheca clavata]|uniref:Patatin-like n=1 Tax=Thraustotheca clavata TaxID=74557 RepID=A0A1V9ZP46_9STRA|nr:Patatin-like [Thraustotheca clavata]
MALLFMDTMMKWYASVPLVIIVALAVLLVSMVVLYVWVASRQIRPRKARTLSVDGRSDGTASAPGSPKAKHMRKRPMSYDADMDTEVNELREEEKELSERDANILWLKAQVWDDTQMQMYLGLTKMFFSSFENEFMEELIRHVKVIEYEPNAVIFERGAADGSILMVAKGSAYVSTFYEDKVYSSTIPQDECLTSMLVQLQALFPSIAKLDLEARAGDAGATILSIEQSVLKSAMELHPKNQLQLAQVSLAQLDRVTARSLIDYFGLVNKVVCPEPLFEVPSEPVDITHIAAHALGLDFKELEEQFRLGTRILTLEDGWILQHQHEQLATNAGDVYFVINGMLAIDVAMSVGGVSDTMVKMYDAKPGCAIGISAAITGDAGTIEARTVGKTTVLHLEGQTFRSLLRHTSFVSSCVKYVLRQYDPLVCLLDNFFEWIHLNSGDSLFHVGDECDSTFTLLTGRLRSIQDHISTTGAIVKTSNELLKGATLCALDMLASRRSAATVYAIRDCQISKMPRVIFDYVLRVYPDVLAHVTREVAYRSTNALPQNNTFPLLGGNRSANTPQLPIGTIAVLAASKDACVHEFSHVLAKALNTIATTEIVSSTKAIEIFGGQWRSLSAIGRARMSNYLAEVESTNQLVLYEADTTLTEWTRLCIRQADHILLLCSETSEFWIEELQGLLRSAYERKKVEINLVRLRRDTDDMSTPMKKLDSRDWISYSHNIRIPFSKYESDLLRVSRRVTGRSIGIVLGGGGARGLAHIGVLKALEECGIDVDVVGGTSMGAFMAGLYAQYPKDLERVIDKSRSFAKAMGSLWNKLRELTLPIASFFNGVGFNQTIHDEFGDIRIEDLVLNFFCISTDIVKYRTGVHRAGPLWRYVRASMSLQGYLPPISDNGSLLLDGGYVNNLPADVMKEEGINIIVAVDVGSDPEWSYYEYGDSLSGWWLLKNKLNPFEATAQVPSMGDVSAALAYCCFEQNKDNVINTCVDLYLKPPVQHIGTLQFEKLDDAIQVGYNYALPKIKEWMQRQPQLFSSRIRRQISRDRTGATAVH